MKEINSDMSRKEKFLTNLSSFLVKNRNVLIVFFAAIIVAIIAAGVISTISVKKNNQIAMMVEEIQNDFDDWTELEAEDETRVEKKDALMVKIDDLLNEDYPQFAQKRVLFIKGQIFFALENWSEAAESFEKSAGILKKSYLTPVSLMCAASAYENNSEYQKALEIYKDVYTNYANMFPDTPRAMLSAGRLSKQLGNMDEAIKEYNQLLDKYPSSPWSDFAKTEIINMK